MDACTSTIAFKNVREFYDNAIDACVCMSLDLNMTNEQAMCEDAAATATAVKHEKKKPVAFITFYLVMLRLCIMCLSPPLSPSPSLSLWVREFCSFPLYFICFTLCVPFDWLIFMCIRFVHTFLCEFNALKNIYIHLFGNSIELSASDVPNEHTVRVVAVGVFCSSKWIEIYSCAIYAI